jgi:hypothetical protein
MSSVSASRGVVASIALAIACGGSTEPTPSMLRVVTDQPTYLVGAAGEVRILNVSPADLQYNECARSLDRYTQGGWSPTSWRAPADANCVDILRTLSAGAEITVSFQLPDTLANGTYRWRFEDFLRDDGSNKLPLWERVSSPFLVTQ